MTDRPGTLLPKPARVTGAEAPVMFADAGVPFDFTFEYPGNWVKGVDRGAHEPYWQVVMLGPRNAEDTYSASLTVRLLPSASVGGQFKNLDALVKERKRRQSRNSGFTVVLEGPLQVAGTPAQELLYSIVVPLSTPARKAAPAVLQSHEVRLSVRGHLYELIYTADQRDFEAYHKVFTHLLESVTLR